MFVTVNHKDGRKINNNAMNLEWCTNLQNMRHAIETGLVVCSRPGVQKGRSLITDDTVKIIRDLKGTDTYENISKQVGISRRQVEKISRKEAWKHVK